MTNNPTAQMPSVLITRSRPAAERFEADLLTEFPQLNVVKSPVLEIVQKGELPELSKYQGVIFTSPNAVERFSASKSVDGCHCFCVGDTTAEAARQMGFSAISAGGSSQDLIDLVKNFPTKGRLVHVRGVHSRGKIAQRLSDMGRPCDTSIVYDQIEQTLNHSAQQLFNEKKPVIVPIFSPRTAELFIKQVQPSIQTYIVAMSQLVAQVFTKIPNIYCRIAHAPTQEAMRHSVVGLLRDANLLEPSAKRLYTTN